MPDPSENAAISPSYRALILLPDGAVTAIQPLVAADDREALILAEAMVDEHAVELWDGLRFIEHFAAPHTAT